MYFRRNNSLPAFYKIGVFKTSARFLGDHIRWNLLSIKLLTFSVGDCFWYLERISNIWYLILNKFFYSINIVSTVTFDEQKRRFCFLGSIKFEKHKPSWCFHDFYFTVELLQEQFLAWKIYLGIWIFKQQITLPMIFLKHNSLQSDRFFNPIFIPCFSESMFFRVQFFQSPGFSGSILFRVQVIQGPGPGFRSSQLSWCF